MLDWWLSRLRKNKLFCLISMGYPAEERKVNDNYYEEKVHYEKF